MATITVTNTTAAPVYCADLYLLIAANGVVTTTRSPAQLESMRSLQQLVAAGTCTLSVAYDANEKASGMVDQGLTASLPTGLSDLQVIRVAIAAGAGGTSDDITVYAVNTLPYNKVRVLDAVAYISAGASTGRKLQIRGAAGGAGTLCAEMNATATGRAAQTVTVTAAQLLTNGSTVGIFVNRSDNAIAGEVQIYVRPEL